MELNYSYAIQREFHRLTAFEMADTIKKLIVVRPKINFEQLEVAQVVYYKSSYGDRDQVLRVVKTTPARKLADVESIDGEYKFRAAKGKYYGQFSVLNDELISFVGLTHEGVVKEAMARGLEIPARVRVRYAEMFVDLPSRFRRGRLTEFMQPSWGKAVTVESIDEMITNSHSTIRKLEEARVKSAAMNPDHKLDYDIYIAGSMGDLDFYRWVRPLVEPSGVFYLNGEKP